MTATDDGNGTDGSTSGASSDGSIGGSPAGQQQPQQHFHILTGRQRRQAPLTADQSRFLWTRAEEMARLGGLVRLRVGRAGLTDTLLAAVASRLRAHEMLRVSVPPESGLERDFVRFVVEGCLDCVTINARGNTFTIYRDSSLPRADTAYGADVDHPGGAATTGNSAGSAPGGSAASGPITKGLAARSRRHARGRVQR